MYTVESYIVIRVALIKLANNQVFLQFSTLEIRAYDSFHLQWTVTECERQTQLRATDFYLVEDSFFHYRSNSFLYLPMIVPFSFKESTSYTPREHKEAIAALCSAHFLLFSLKSDIKLNHKNLVQKTFVKLNLLFKLVGLKI